MLLKTDIFEAATAWTIDPEDTYIQFPKNAEADLLSILSKDGEYMYLAVQDHRKYEVVKVTRDGADLLYERGVAGTKAARFAAGVCVSGISPIAVQVMKDLICSYSCCEDGDCECDPVAVGGSSLPDGVVGKPWSGAVAFTGDAPITVTVNSTPSWMTAVVEGNMVHLSGTPSVAGVQYFSVAAANCGGRSIDSRAFAVNVKREQ